MNLVVRKLLNGLFFDFQLKGGAKITKSRQSERAPGLAEDLRCRIGKKVKMSDLFIVFFVPLVLW